MKLMNESRVYVNSKPASAFQGQDLQPIPNRLVVLTFDDGNKSDTTHVAPLLKRYGFGATFFITEGLNFLENKAHYVTWKEVRELHEAGFEIGNHTRRHKNVNHQSAVLTFHGVPALEHPWVNTEPETFEACMDYQYDTGCTVISLRDLAKYVDPIQGRDLPCNY